MSSLDRFKPDAPDVQEVARLEEALPPEHPIHVLVDPVRSVDLGHFVIPIGPEGEKPYHPHALFGVSGPGLLARGALGAVAGMFGQSFESTAAGYRAAGPRIPRTRHGVSFILLPPSAPSASTDVLRRVAGPRLPVRPVPGRVVTDHGRRGLSVHGLMTACDYSQEGAAARYHREHPGGGVAWTP